MKQQEFFDVVREAGETLERESISHAFIGGIATSYYAGYPFDPGSGEDVDIFVAPQNARTALRALEELGYEAEETNSYWIFKAKKGAVTVDLIFRHEKDVYFDEEMSMRCNRVEFEGIPLALIPPEDLVVMKALDHEEEKSHYWQDGIRIIQNGTLDWEYLRRRSRLGARRVLSLLTFCRSIESKAVPLDVFTNIRADIGV